MPIAKGVFDLYRELLGGGAVVRLYVDAQGNHGRGPYNLPDGSCEYVAPAIQLFKKTFRGMPPAAYQEFKFSKRAEYLFSDGATIEIDDVGGLYETLGPNPPRFAYVVDRNLGDPLRLFVDGFVYDSTIIVPSGFRYEPIQTILEAGDSPETIRTEFGLP